MQLSRAKHAIIQCAFILASGIVMRSPMSDGLKVDLISCITILQGAAGVTLESNKGDGKSSPVV